MEIEEVKRLKKFVYSNLDNTDLDIKLLCIQYIIQLLKEGEIVKFYGMKSDASEYQKYLNRPLAQQDYSYFYKTPNHEIYSNEELITQFDGGKYYFAINPEFDEQNRS